MFLKSHGKVKAAAEFDREASAADRDAKKQRRRKREARKKAKKT